MQALYAYLQSESNDIKKSSNEMVKSFYGVEDLYYWVLALLNNLHQTAEEIIEESKNKRFPTASDLNPNTRFVDNKFLTSLSKNQEVIKIIEKKRLYWKDDQDLIRKIFQDIRKSEVYKKNLESKESGLLQEKNFLIQILEEILIEHDLVIHFFEGKNVHWADDLFVAFLSVKKTIETFDGDKLKLQPLFREEQEDVEFAIRLFEKCVQNRAYFDELIADKTVNWEVDRIALMDVLLMKMALTEVLFFENIPVKVSLNEYIDISKEYSTPKSKIFINGVLDKIVIELKNQNKIVKTGRGLVEN